MTRAFTLVSFIVSRAICNASCASLLTASACSIHARDHSVTEFSSLIRFTLLRIVTKSWTTSAGCSIALSRRDSIAASRANASSFVTSRLEMAFYKLFIRPATGAVNSIHAFAAASKTSSLLGRLDATSCCDGAGSWGASLCCATAGGSGISSIARSGSGPRDPVWRDDGRDDDFGMVPELMCLGCIFRF